MVEYCLRRQTHQIDGNEVIVTKVIPKFDEEDQVNIDDQDGEDQVNVGDQDGEDQVNVGDQDVKDQVEIGDQDVEDQVNVGDQDGEDQVEIGDQDDAEKVDWGDQDNGAPDKVDGGSENLICNSDVGVEKDVNEEAENATSQDVEREVSTEEIGNSLV